MANSHVTTVIEDGPRNLNVNLVGVLDSTDQPPTVMVSRTNCEVYKPTKFRLDDIEYSISDQLIVCLAWEGTPDTLILPLAGRGILHYHDGGLQNNAYQPTGALKVYTTGYQNGIQTYNIQLSLVKQGGY